MKTYRNKSLLLVAALLAACTFPGLLSCGDDDVSPSPDNRLVEFPQGDNAYDADIWSVYLRYGTQMLYRYSDAMFRWQVTDQLGYVSTPADEAYVSSAVSFIQRNCFCFYTDDSLKMMLPYRIYLASNIGKIFDYSGTDATGQSVSVHDTIPGIGAVSGYCNIAFGLASSRLPGLKEDSLQIVKGELNAAVLAYGLGTGLFEVPAAFTKLEYSGVNWGNFTGVGGYNAYGMLEYVDAKTVTPAQDFALYLKYLIAYPTEKFDARFTAKTFDSSGRIAQKAKVVREWMLSEYGIDVVAMADAETRL